LNKPFQIKNVESPTAEDLAAHLATILYEAQDRYKNYADRTWKIHLNFHIGDQAWLLPQNIQTKRQSKKLDYQQLGPFKIIAQVNPVSYHLELPPTMHIHPVLHVFLLEPYQESQIPHQIPPPPPSTEINHDVEYEVKEILDSRIQYRCLEYFIHWKDYGISERTWEPSFNCQNAFDKIREFHRRYPSKPGMIGK
jgi:hypothetical protein